MELFLILAASAIVAIVYSCSRTSNSRPPRWRMAENGNLGTVVRGSRVTVIQSDGGWKFCVASAAGDVTPPFFSEPYATVEQAQHEALAMVRGQRPKYRSLTERRALRRMEAVGKFST